MSRVLILLTHRNHLYPYTHTIAYHGLHDHKSVINIFNVVLFNGLQTYIRSDKHYINIHIHIILMDGISYLSRIIYIFIAFKRLRIAAFLFYSFTLRHFKYQFNFLLSRLYEKRVFVLLCFDRACTASESLLTQI